MKEKSLATGRTVAFVAAIVLAAALALAMALQTNAAYAESSSSANPTEKSSSAASAASGQAEGISPTAPFGGLPLMGNDYVWFGRNLTLGSHTIQNDLIAAAQQVSIDDCTVVGDMRIAAQNINITNSSAGENITVAAQTVKVKGGNANAVAIAGSSASYSGMCSELTVYAEKVFIDGTVTGDVAIGANSVEIGSNARIMGTLHVSAPQEPVMQRGAEVSKVDFTQAKSGASSADVGEAFAALASTFFLLSVFMSIFGTIIIAILAEWLFRRHTAAAADMIRNRTGATIGSGIIGAIVAPIVIIVLFCLVVTIPAAGALTLALFAMTMVASGFAGASLFKLAFKRMNRFVCALVGGAIMGVAGAIPFLGSLVGVAAFMYLLGYVLQSIFLGMRKPAPGGPAMQAPIGANVPPAPGVANPAPTAPMTATPAPTAPLAAPPASAPTAPNAPTPGGPVPPQA